MKDDDILKMIEKEIDDEITSQVISGTDKKKSGRNSVNKSSTNALPKIGSDFRSNPESQKPDLINVDNSSILDGILESQSPQVVTPTLENNNEIHESVDLGADLITAPGEGNVDVSELNKLQLQLDALKHDVVALQNQLEDCKKERNDLRGSIQAEQNIQTVFGERGLIGHTEIVAAIKSLTAAKKLTEFVSSISIVDEPRVRRLLNEHVQLVSKNVPKELSSGHARVLVPAERCELAGEINVDFAQRRFIDGLVVNGHRQVLILGAPVRMLTPLRTLAAHHQLQFTLGPSINRLTVECLRPLLAEKPLILLWNPTGFLLDPNLIPVDEASLKSSSARSLAAFLFDIGEQLLPRSSAVDAE